MKQLTMYVGIFLGIIIAGCSSPVTVSQELSIEQKPTEIYQSENSKVTITNTALPPIDTVIPATNTPFPTTETPKPTNTAMPTETSSPSPTLTASPVPTSLSTKQVLAVLGLSGGDGTRPSFAYLGVGTPNLIIYTDGHMLFREGGFGFWEDESGYIFKQASLTTNELCSLAGAIQDTGFFEVEGDGFGGIDDPIYRFDDSVIISEGGPYYMISVNGVHPKSVLVYYSYMDYVVDEIRLTYDILSNFSLSKDELYQPDEVVLWIEEGDADIEQQVQIWPNSLPHLSELISSIDRKSYKGVLVQEDVELLMQLFDYRMKELPFMDEGQIYLVSARPLLPHELAEDLPWGKELIAEVTLPIDCTK